MLDAFISHPMYDERARPANSPPEPVTSAVDAWLDAERRVRATAGDGRSDGTFAEQRSHTLRLLCAAAHQHGVRVEQVIVLLKHRWAALPRAAAPWDEHDARLALAEIVHTWIEQYYHFPESARVVDDGATTGRGAGGATSRA
jgi:hypothetical protein